MPSISQGKPILSPNGKPCKGVRKPTNYSYDKTSTCKGKKTKKKQKQKQKKTKKKKSLNKVGKAKHIFSQW